MPLKSLLLADNSCCCDRRRENCFVEQENQAGLRRWAAATSTPMWIDGRLARRASLYSRPTGCWRYCRRPGHWSSRKNGTTLIDEGWSGLVGSKRATCCLRQINRSDPPIQAAFWQTRSQDPVRLEVFQQAIHAYRRAKWGTVLQNTALSVNIREASSIFSCAPFLTVRGRLVFETQPHMPVHLGFYG